MIEYFQGVFKEFYNMSKTWKIIIISLVITMIALPLTITGCASPSQDYVDLNKKLISAHRNVFDAWVKDRLQAAEISKKMREEIGKITLDKEKKDALIKELENLIEIDPIVIDSIKKSIEEIEKVNQQIEERNKK